MGGWVDGWSGSIRKHVFIMSKQIIITLRGNLEQIVQNINVIYNKKKTHTPATQRIYEIYETLMKIITFLLHFVYKAVHRFLHFVQEGFCCSKHTKTD